MMIFWGFPGTPDPETRPVEGKIFFQGGTLTTNLLIKMITNYKTISCQLTSSERLARL